jgi:hypothetical protein
MVPGAERLLGIDDQLDLTGVQRNRFPTRPDDHLSDPEFRCFQRVDHALYVAQRPREFNPARLDGRGVPR